MLEINEITSILKGSYTITTPEDTLSGRYKLPRGKGYVIINIGAISLGDNAETEKEKLIKEFKKNYCGEEQSAPTKTLKQ